MYYNTTHQSGSVLSRFADKTESQEKDILLLFHTHKALSPSQAFHLLHSIQNRILLTSVRRAITNLTDQGCLSKSSTQIPGMHGRPEYVWQFVPCQEDQTVSAPSLSETFNS